ncbi:mechanosensitive ion channel protein MscS [Ammoniphilus oxalaticus]|uniref:Mechanosensitive ion channel protein MscS n=2 Tax=Ammoniphilus oxalaticus TaxID=66863 RepID=A0A419SHF9_9BACL|nr:mechanosensitive ion channel protein MscS [Ammoniphilus oxalaticus]
MNWFETIYLEAYQYITDSSIWIKMGEAAVKILLIIVAAKISARVGIASIDRVFKQRGKLKVNERRIETMRSLVRNVASYVIYFIAILLVLSELNFELAPVLASAGVIGLAVGFGAQNLVRDVITGFFIIFEDQYAVGDYVTIGAYTGTVQEFGLRITKIKSYTGEINIIPNGSITEVTNFSVQNSLAVLDVRVAYEEDLERVKQVLEMALLRAHVEIEDIIADPEIVGVQDLGISEILIRVTAECNPTTQFSVNRQLRALIKQAFDEEGIRVPYPRFVTIPQEVKNE